MKIMLKNGRHWSFRVVAETGQVKSVTSDWDFPSVAAAFGWERNGLTGDEMIWDAYEFLERHVGRRVDDAGFFDSQVCAPATAGAFL